MKFFEDKDLKKITILFISVIIIATLVFGVIFLWYNNSLTNEAEFSSLNVIYSNSTTNKVSNTNGNENSISVSFSDDKDIANKVNTEENNLNENTENIAVKTNVEENNIAKASNEQAIDESEFEGNEIDVQEYVFAFEVPVSGEILKDFAQDTLTYSKTLDEWTTHLGIDIKAEKTSVVKASERGKIESIKNDPRYGLTVIIEHQDGFKTVYSNLLTTEFVVEGDEVEKGQTIGTVGQSASFETLDESHLHFEMYKDGTPVNPTIYFK